MTKVPNKISVNSSVIEAIKYEGGSLLVYFKEGQVYSYTGVPASVFEQFKTAHSKGKFLHENIAGRYLYTRVV